MTKEIQIPYGKLKFFLVMIGSLLLVLLGIMILIAEEAMTSIMYRNELFNRIIAVSCILFFGAISVTAPIIFFKKKMGIIINEQGITDYSTFSSIGLIEWKDIKGIRMVDFKKTKALLIDTNKPKKYLDMAKSGFKKRMLNSNNRIYGTPIYITATILDISVTDLESIMTEAFNKEAH